MAISQEQLHEVVMAARRIADQIIADNSEVIAMIEGLRNGGVSPREFIAKLLDRAIAPMAGIEREMNVIELEEAHYQWTHKRNAAERRRKQRLRAGGGPLAHRPTRRSRIEPLDYDPATQHQIAVARGLITEESPDFLSGLAEAAHSGASGHSGISGASGISVEDQNRIKEDVERALRGAGPKGL